MNFCFILNSFYLGNFFLHFTRKYQWISKISVPFRVLINWGRNWNFSHQFWNQKSNNLHYKTLVPWANETNDLATLQENRRIDWMGFYKEFFEERITVGTRVSTGRDIPGQTGTGRPVVPLSWDKKNSLSRCPFVPGQKKFLVPVSRCPGTRAGANVPGQIPLSRPIPGQND